MLGYTSIFCWLNAQIPQIIENFKLSSAGEISQGAGFRQGTWSRRTGTGTGACSTY
ncbi:hypothetical protein BGX30_003707 [Mortierella sp. GBA39]|nr:hypothetical protein BGX30_003707 [Mortierella sp. GBA39]